MDRTAEKELLRIKAKEKMLDSKGSLAANKLSNVMNKVEDKIPDGLAEKLELAFYKGFGFVFNKGAEVIEKTYNKDGMDMDFRAYKGIMLNDGEALVHFRKKLDKSLKKDLTLTALEGTGLGILGIGLPDIPIFIAVILRSIYKIAAAYGFDYNLDSERCYILKLITGAMSTGEDREKIKKQIKRMEYLICNNIYETNADREMKKASSIMANELITYKFVQGMPVVGILGGYTNVKTLSRIVSFAHLNYERRCIELLQSESR